MISFVLFSYPLWSKCQHSHLRATYLISDHDSVWKPLGEYVWPLAVRMCIIDGIKLAYLLWIRMYVWKFINWESAELSRIAPSLCIENLVDMKNRLHLKAARWFFNTRASSYSSSRPFVFLLLLWSFVSSTSWEIKRRLWEKKKERKKERTEMKKSSKVKTEEKETARSERGSNNANKGQEQMEKEEGHYNASRWTRLMM